MAFLDIEIGDRVFCIHYGWGVVRTISGWMDYPIEVYFDSCHSDSYNLEGRMFDYMIPTLSFTEYKIDGLTQEKPEPLPNKGDVVWVRDHDEAFWIVVHFIKKVDNKYIVSNNNPFTYSYTEYDEWNFMTTKNPYKNEDSI